MRNYGFKIGITGIFIFWCLSSRLLGQSPCKACEDFSHSEEFTNKDKKDKRGKVVNDLTECYKSHVNWKKINQVINLGYTLDTSVFKTEVRNLCKEICANDEQTMKQINRTLDSTMLTSNNKKSSISNFSAIKFKCACIVGSFQKTQPSSALIPSTGGAEKNQDIIFLKDKIADLEIDNKIFFTLFVVFAILSLGLLIWLFYPKKQKFDQNRAAETTNRDKYKDETVSAPNQDHNNSISRLEKQLSEARQQSADLLNKINKLEEENRELKRNPTQVAQQSVSASPPKPATVLPLNRIFVSMPSGKAFYRTNDSLIVQETYFVIEYHQYQNEGTITLVDDPSTRSHAYSMIDGLRGVCELRGTGRPTLSTKVHIEPGRVERTPDAWVLKSPIVLSW